MKNTKPSKKWTFKVGQKKIIKNSAKVPDYIWKAQPDGHISVLPDGEGNYMMYWGLSIAWRTVGPSAYPETMKKSDPNRKVFGGQFDDKLSWDNGGSWLMSVLRLPDKRLVGFYHAEDHWNPLTNPTNIAWKSIGVAYSSDNGRSWGKGKQIITAYKKKPPKPKWGGAGDNSAVWDCLNKRYLMYFSEKITNDYKISLALTTDRNGFSGWKKWNGNRSKTKGLGGKSVPLNGLSKQAGANPSVQWNRYLGKWVIVWHGWNGNIYLSTSSDGVYWDDPFFVTKGIYKAWYPTLISKRGGDTVGGKTVRLYYADMYSLHGDPPKRDFSYKTITFTRYD